MLRTDPRCVLTLVVALSSTGCASIGKDLGRVAAQVAAAAVVTAAAAAIRSDGRPSRPGEDTVVAVEPINCAEIQAMRADTRHLNRAPRLPPECEPTPDPDRTTTAYPTM
jgi:hypothetical protein